MPSIHKTALTPYTPTQMFDLVNDIESYPLFLPGCAKVMILDRDAKEVKATVHIAKGSFNKSFSTLNILDPSNSITMKLLDGPFEYLEGAWRFETVEKGEGSDQKSRITLDLDYKFQNKMMALVAGPIITKLLESFVDSFCQRAIEVYGKRP
jgi:ribosome-associated toxin RatA of RatAB toxin-antitoxin module